MLTLFQSACRIMDRVLIKKNRIINKLEYIIWSKNEKHEIQPMWQLSACKDIYLNQNSGLKGS